jgi:hypothetical protein
MRRLFPYNPKENPKYADKVKDWQNATYDASREGVQSTYEGHENMPNERARALHKLASLTPVRRNSSGRREFLLHRGVSTKEREAVKLPWSAVRVNHENLTSWTPHLPVAQSFAKEYLEDNEDDNDRNLNTLSAWVDEKHIGHIPNQALETNNFKHEHEVFVKPGHESKLASEDDLRRINPEGVHSKINTRKWKVENAESRRKDLERQIAYNSEIVDKNKHNQAYIKPYVEWVNQLKNELNQHNTETSSRMLAKATPDQRVAQAEGQDWDRETQPRRATYDFSKLHNHQVKRLGPGLYHHTGEHKNVTFHVLSRSGRLDPSYRPLAAMAVGHTNDGNYLLDAHRAHGADKGKGYVNRLWDIVQDKHPDIKVARVSHESAHLPEWKDYHSDLFHDVIPDVPVKHLDSGVAGAQVVGKGDEPTVLVKPPMTQKLNDRFRGRVPVEHQHFLHPNFTTSHREAMYHLLADSVFGLGHFVPRTTVFKHPVTSDPFSAMEWLKQTSPFIGESQIGHLHNSGDTHKMAIMDFVLGNNDRHKNNILFDRNGDMKLIDHGLAFDYGGMASAGVPAYAKGLLEDRVPQKVHKWVQSINPDRLVETMKSRGAPEHVAEMAGRRMRAIHEWSAKNQRTDNTPSGKLGEAYGKAKAYSFGKSPAQMDQEARVSDQATEISEPTQLVTPGKTATSNTPVTPSGTAISNKGKS